MTNHEDSQAGDELRKELEAVIDDVTTEKRLDGDMAWTQLVLYEDIDFDAISQIAHAYAERLATRRAVETRIHESGIHIVEIYNRMLRLDRGMAEAELKRLVDRSDLPALTKEIQQ